MPIAGTIALLALLPLLASSPTTGRMFTVDDLLRLEQVCRVVFDPSGETLLFERVAAYEDSGSFVEPWHGLGWDRSKLYGIDLVGSTDAARLLFEQLRDDGYWFGSFSPTGSKAAVYHRTSSGAVGIGVYDFEQRKFVPTGSSPEVLWYFGPHHAWLSDTTLIYAALPADRQPPDFGRQPRERLPRLWRQAREGTAATVSVLKSGRIADGAHSHAEGSLMKVDTVSGTTSVLARGDFLELQAAPEKRHVAAIKRGESLRPDPGRPLEHHALRWHASLVLLSTSAAGGEVTVCPVCDTMPGSLRWSEDGERLLFFARRRGESWADGRHYRYWLSTGSLEPLLPHGLEAARSRAYSSPPVKAEWLEDGALVFARPAGPSGEPARSDWYFVDAQGSALKMTASFTAPPPEVATVSGDSAYFVSEGNLWRVSADGSRQNLTKDLDAAVALWQPLATVGCTDHHARDTSRLVLRVRERELSKFLLLELATGEHRTLDAPSQGAKLLAVSKDARAAVFLEQRFGRPERLTMALADQGILPLLEFNAHMVDVAQSHYVRVARTDEKTADPLGWLLLPPGHSPRDRHPLIVQVYPGSVRSSKPGKSLYQPHPLNPHLLAGQGYAVLFPNIPLTPEGKPGDPLIRLAERVMPAIDLVIEDGYADPERIGLFGHSYGAYGALWILSQTNRFKAAVAANGVYDLFSNYGSFDVRFRLDTPGALRLFQASWSESGQGRMGVSPWQDPQRYLRNSPLRHAERIDTPLMLVHGDLDYVSMVQSEQMFTALYRLGKEAVYLRYWGEGHVLASPANIRDFWRRVFAWYDRYLQPTTGGARRDPCVGRQAPSPAAHEGAPE